MKDRYNLHFLQESNISQDFISFNEREFCDEHHEYVFSPSKDYIRIALKVFRSKKIHIHGMFDRSILIFLLLLPFKRKVIWYLWGADVYNDIYKSKFRHKIFNAIIKKPFVTRHVDYVATYLKGDSDFVEVNYGFSGRVINHILYPSNVPPEQWDCEPLEAEKKILIGNSSVPENNHLKVLALLEGCDGLEGYSVVMPMSYGDQDYLAFVESRLAMESRNVSLVKDFLSLADYQRLLSSVQLCIFYHEYQMAMGNIIFLLSIGKLIVLNPETSPYEFFIRKGIFVLPISELQNFKGIAVYENQLLNNINIVKRIFNRRELVAQWREVYSL